MVKQVNNLKRIRARLVGDKEPAIEIPFELVCECGERISGVRRSTAIQKDCESCGAVLYVLPANVYPATPSVESEVIGGTFVNRLRVVTSEILFPNSRVDSSNGKNSGEPSDATKTEAASEDASDQSEDNVGGLSGLISKVRGFSFPRLDLRKLLRSIFTPFRIVMVSILAVVGLTGYWLSLQQSQEAARQVWLNASDEIQALIDAGDLNALEATSARAVVAGRRLGKSDSEWRSILNLSEEAYATNRLASADLLTAFRGAYTESGELSDHVSSNPLPQIRRGHFVFDTWIRHDVRRQGSFRCELPAAPGLHLVQAVIAMPELSSLVGDDKERRAVFAAAIDSVESPGSETGDVWVIHIRPDSLVLLTEPSIVESVGFSLQDDTSLETILAEQSRFVNETETWEFRADSPSLAESEDGKTIDNAGLVGGNNAE